MYHRVVSRRCPVPGGDPDEARYAVSLDSFQRQLDCLTRLKRTGVSMHRVVEHIDDGHPVPEDWVAITFDDGNESDYVHATPMLRERGFDATFFVTGCRVDADGGLTREMIGEMAGAGMHIGAHGMTHRFLTTLGNRDEEGEIASSQALLGEIAGTPVDHFAPPGGRCDARTLATLGRLSFHAVCTSRFGFNSRNPVKNVGGFAGFTFSRIPITSATSASRFGAIATGAVWRLLPLYARSRGLLWFRRFVGEQMYRRLRTRGLRR
jgi:peptidoglycan/xylan/chitin deacetylase (PgdA/CDA1 family)